MLFSIRFFRVAYVSIFLVLTACSDGKNSNIIDKGSQSKQDLKILKVYKRASCGCCNKWVEHIKQAGFQAVVRDENNLNKFKEEKGIKAEYQSCHTAVSSEGLVFEGHIPAKFIQQFIKKTPEGAFGLSVPAMPLGSPGMEVGEQFSPYEIILLNKDGTTDVYAKIETYKEQF